MTEGGVEILRTALAVRPEARGVVGAGVREVAFLRLVDEDTGRVGFGECAPLPGLHRETLDEAIASLEEWSDGACDLDAMPPSAAFAASGACAMLDGFGAAPCGAALVAGFLGGGGAECDALEALRRAGVGSVKVKIGRATAAEDRALVARVLEALPDARLRLDGNRRMTPASVVEVVRGVDPARIEYLEEPISDPTQLAELARATGMPVALDELVVDGSSEARALRGRLTRSGCVAAWVLRMSAIGSLEAIRACAAEAAAAGADAVLSTAYESSFALRVAVHLAATIPNARRAHGIGTAALLAEDSCAPARVVRGGIAGDILPVPFAEAWS